MLFFKKKPAQKIFLFNTASKEKEKFSSLRSGKMKLYTCGPTVYDYAHVGNLRAVVFPDIVRRVFEYAGYSVTSILNFTDFGHLASDTDDTSEDKMTLALRREGKELTMENMYTVGSAYIESFKLDLQELNVKTFHAMPRASEHVRGMIAYVETLLDKGYAYKISDGVYFDTEQFPHYGCLGGSASEEHSRVGVSSEKKNSRDFALWKFNDELGWDAPWGKGFPGWHIECTAMSTHYLGKTLDIHAGGVDLVPIHHNNEIAQAEAANSKSYATYWLHNEFVTIERNKISKSLGNTVTLKQLTDKGISPLAYRYWLLTGHYRSPMNFTWEAVKGAQTALTRAQKIFADLKGNGAVDDEYKKRFDAALFDDFNTPEAVAVLWEILKDESMSDANKRTTVLTFDTVLGLGFLGSRARGKGAKVSVASELSDEVTALVDQREKARNEKNFQEADTLRTQIAEAGYTIEDGKDGPVVRKSSQ